MEIDFWCYRLIVRTLLKVIFKALTTLLHVTVSGDREGPSGSMTSYGWGPDPLRRVSF